MTEFFFLTELERSQTHSHESKQRGGVGYRELGQWKHICMMIAIMFAMLCWRWCNLVYGQWKWEMRERETEEGESSQNSFVFYGSITLSLSVDELFTFVCLRFTQEWQKFKSLSPEYDSWHAVSDSRCGFYHDNENSLCESAMIITVRWRSLLLLLLLLLWLSESFSFFLSIFSWRSLSEHHKIDEWINLHHFAVRIAFNYRVTLKISLWIFKLLIFVFHWPREKKFYFHSNYQKSKIKLAKVLSRKKINFLRICYIIFLSHVTILRKVPH